MKLQLALERREAGWAGHYAASNAIRQTVSKHGTSFNDKQHIFITASGLHGNYSLSGGVSFDKVQYICLDCEEARRCGDYAGADEIRDRLPRLGMTVDDEGHIFCTRDGSQGSFNLRKVPPLTCRNGQAPPLPPPAETLPLPVRGRIVKCRMSLNDPGLPPPFGPSSPSSVVVRRPPASSAAAQVVPSGQAVSTHVPPSSTCTLPRRGDYATAQKEVGMEVHDWSHTLVYRGLDGSCNLQESLGSQEVQYMALDEMRHVGMAIMKQATPCAVL